MTINGEMIVWCEPMERAKPKVVGSDIPKALAWFKEKTGQDAKKICLHPSLASLEVPEGIQVELVGGCLAWEVWLSDDGSVVPARITQADVILGHENAEVVSSYPPGIMSTLTGKKSEVDIIQPSVGKVTREKRGPKFTELPEDLIRQLAGEGMGSKAIASRLKAEGLEISYKTIQRRLAGMTATKDNTLLHDGGIE